MTEPTAQTMLLPCPFCGEQPTHWPHLSLVKCKCHAQALSHRWNTRPAAAPDALREALEVWIEENFTGHGRAVRLQSEPSIHGEPFMSMAIAKDLTRQAVTKFRSASAPDVQETITLRELIELFEAAGFDDDKPHPDCYTDFSFVKFFESYRCAALSHNGTSS